MDIPYFVSRWWLCSHLDLSWEQNKSSYLLASSILTPHNSGDLIPFMYRTNLIGIWSERGSYDNYTTPRTNMNPKRVMELILGLTKSPWWQQQSPRAITILEPSSDSTVSEAWITEPATDSWLGSKQLWNSIVWQVTFNRFLHPNEHSQRIFWYLARKLSC